MPRQRMLTIEMGRAENPNEPYTFDGKPRRYIARSAQGRFGAAMFPWDEVEALRTELQDGTPTSAVRRKMGDLLRRFLEDVLKELGGWKRIEDALVASEGKPAPTLLHFRFSAAELFCLPWAMLELSCARSLGSLQPYPVQFEWASDTVAQKPSSHVGRVLFAWSDAAGPVYEAEHLSALRGACPAFDPAEDALARVDLESLREKLKKARAEGRPFSILHFLCHGGPMLGGTFGLYWTNPERAARPAPIDGDRLRDVLAPYLGDLQTVVLSACHGGDPGLVGSMFGGVAHDLHRLGIPAVVASLLPLSVDGSIRMTGAFYTALCQRKASLLEAYQQAHEALNPSSLDGASLQFFTQAPCEAAHAKRPAIVFSPDAVLPELSEEVAVAYEVNFTVASAAIVEALRHEAPDVIALRPFATPADALPSTPKEWRSALQHADRLMDVLGPQVDSVHLFGRAPLPLMFHLGWRLSRLKLRAYQEQRGRNGVWDCRYDSSVQPTPGARFFQEYTLPDSEACRAAGGRLVMTVEVYPLISDEDLATWLGSSGALRWCACGWPGRLRPRCWRGPWTRHARWRSSASAWTASTRRCRG
ncbi:CHAT domain-containing protein [Pyxidicoccus sp. 3LG]